LAGFYYDSSIDHGDAHARVPAIRDAGGPRRWDGGSEELTARLNCPGADLAAVLLAALPVGALDLDQLPDHLTRALFEALRLQTHYDAATNTATCRVTLSADTINAAAERQPARRSLSPLPHAERKDNPDMHPEKPNAQLLPFPSLWCTQRDSAPVPPRPLRCASVAENGGVRQGCWPSATALPAPPATRRDRAATPSCRPMTRRGRASRPMRSERW